MAEKTHYPLIRTIYLYLFALLGLALLTIGSVRFLDMGLKAFVFTKADEQIDYILRPPIIAVYPGGKEISEDDFISAIEKCQEKCELTDEQQKQMTNWLKDYKNWQEQPKIDYKTQRRHRDASLNLALILIGLPLYFYHWSIIKKETKNKKEEQ